MGFQAWVSAFRVCGLGYEGFRQQDIGFRAWFRICFVAPFLQVRWGLGLRV